MLFLVCRGGAGGLIVVTDVAGGIGLDLVLANCDVAKYVVVLSLEDAGLRRE